FGPGGIEDGRGRGQGRGRKGERRHQPYGEESGLDGGRRGLARPLLQRVGGGRGDVVGDVLLHLLRERGGRPREALRVDALHDLPEDREGRASARLFVPQLAVVVVT